MAESTLPSSIAVNRVSNVGNVQYEGPYEDLFAAGLLPRDWPTPPPVKPAGNRWKSKDGRNCRLGRRVVDQGGTPRYVFRVTVEATSSERAAAKHASRDQAEQRRADERERAVETACQAVARAKAAGLEVRHYPPRFTDYIGSEAQLRAHAPMPERIKFPVREQGKDWASLRWQVGATHYYICSRNTSQANRSANLFEDHWLFKVVDTSVPYSDNIVLIWRRENAAR